MNTTKDLSKSLGRFGFLRTAEGLSVKVNILDAKEVWGCVRYLVSPVDGSGTAWVDRSRCQLQPFAGEAA